MKFTNARARMVSSALAACLARPALAAVPVQTGTMVVADAYSVSWERDWNLLLLDVLTTVNRLQQESPRPGPAAVQKSVEGFIRPGLERLVWERTKHIVDSSVVGSLSEADRSSLHALVAREVGERLSAAAAAAAAEPYEAVKTAIREGSSAAWSEAIVARWLGHAAPAVVPVVGPSDVTRQVRWQGADGALGLTGSRLQLLEEVSPAYSRDGRLQAGEWGKLSLTVVNAGTKPLFSTSAFVESGHSCVLVESSEERVLEELPVGASTTLTFWALVSNQCSDEGVRRVLLRVRDTHRAGEATLGLEFDAGELPMPTLPGVKLDTDMPGSSDGSSADVLRAGLAGEIWVDVSSTGQAASEVRTAFAIPADAQSLFAGRPTYRDVPLERVSDTEFHASDDLDFVTVPSAAFEKARRGLASSAVWANREAGARVWLAVDTKVLLAASRRPKAAEVPAPAAMPERAVPAASKVAELVRRHLALLARPAKPASPDGLLSTDGYDLVFDEAAFKAEFDDLTAPRKAPAAKAEAAAPAPVAYTFRHYLAVPLAPWVPPPPPPPARAEPVAVAAPASGPAPDFHLTVGLTAAATMPKASAAEVHVAPFARASYGHAWRYLAQLSADRALRIDADTTRPAHLALMPLGVARAFEAAQGEWSIFGGLGLGLDSDGLGRGFGEAGLLGRLTGTRLEGSLSYRRWSDQTGAALVGAGYTWDW
jgi:hypothetical protein